MMIRILSILPAAMGVICAILVLVSLYSPTLDSSRTDIPLVPCTDDDVGCPVGLSGDDMGSPLAFMLLDIEVTIEWDQFATSWIGVIESPPPDGCEPDSNGLTACTAEDFDFIAGGPEEDGGSLTFDLKPGDYRFATASTETSGVGGEQLVTITPQIALNPIAEILLTIVSVLLLAGSGEMFAHRSIMRAWKRFKDT
ncbi:MAG: hypothetical protein CM1200mP21_08230 [Candidatus Poseidoniales archaeon]|nr:MAG: hypothetical protein CM1200mP21_08230 [Candidatus Poseidoniales archaeon]